MFADFQPETIPIEFPLVAFAFNHEQDREAPLLGLYRCPLCSALVLHADAQPHTAWHGAERARNFAGF